MNPISSELLANQFDFLRKKGKQPQVRPENWSLEEVVQKSDARSNEQKQSHDISISSSIFFH